MNTTNPLIFWYTRRLLSRDLALLAHYYQHGHGFRMSLPLYWRYSLLPIAAVGIYFLVRYLWPEFGEVGALAAMSGFVLGQITADYQLYIMNRDIWQPMRGLVDWGKVQRRAGKEAVLQQPAPPAHVKQVVRDRLKLYLHIRDNPPSPRNTIMQSPDIFAIGFFGSIAMIVMNFVDGQAALYVLAIGFFIISQSIKKLKVTLDTAFIWPEISLLFCWDDIQRLAGPSLQSLDESTK